MGVGSGVFLRNVGPTKRRSPASVQSREELGSQALVASPSASGQRPRFFQPLPSARRQNQGSDGASMPGSFRHPGGASQPEPRPGLCPRERLAPVPAFPAERPLCSDPEQEGREPGSVVRGLLSSPLCFHGNFISSKLLTELRIYDQKIKSLDLFETEVL